jgi:glycosyltransferase involved in cell wall biosynthesis
MKRKLFYFGLESLASRYTTQLTKEWAPAAFENFNESIEFVNIPGSDLEHGDVAVGMVLDAVGRGIYSMSQVQHFLSLIRAGEVRDNDIVYFADFWTPGLESIFYALDLYKIKNVKFYARNWAQSMDEYDFTYQMRHWMRWYELGLDSKLSGVFCGSTEHKNLMVQAGFKAPIHVLSLPVHKQLTLNRLNANAIVPGKQRNVIYCSRLDKEKNPYFMLEVAKKFLYENPDWNWVITTSSSKLRSNVPQVIDDIYEFARTNSRFKVLENLTKEQYYEQLSKAYIQFNSALQDWVSFTCIESTMFGCDIVYPDFRSFKEFVPKNRKYHAFDVDDAVNTLTNTAKAPVKYDYVSDIADLGLYLEAYIIANDISDELNVWQETEYCKKLRDASIN